MNIHEKYHEIAEQSLSRGRVDGEAYLVKVLSEIMMQNPTNSSEMQANITEYNVQNVEELESTLNGIKRTLSEILHTCDTQEKIKICKRVFKEISEL